MKNKILLKLLPISVAVLCSNLNGLWAATITNSDSGLNFTNGAAWIGGVVPGSADVALFDSTITAGTPANATNLLGANLTWAGIKILNPAVPLQISAGSTLTNGASGLDMSQATTSLTLNNAVGLVANQSWLVANGQTLNINGVISGTNVLTYNNSSLTNGTININVANTYTGGTIINGGLIVVSNSTALGAAAGTITFLGGTIKFGPAAGFTIGNPLVFSNTVVLDGNVINTNNGNDTLSLPMSGNGTIIISNLQGYYTNDLSPVETITLGSSAAGQTMNNFSGKIIVAATNSAGLTSGGNIRFNGGATVNTGSTNFSLDLGLGTVAITIRNGGTVNIGELKGGPLTTLLGSRSTTPSVDNYSIGGLNTSTTFAGIVRDSTVTNNEQTSLTKVGTGTLTLTGSLNTYSGGTTISLGTLQIGDGGADGTFGVGPITIASGALLVFNRPDTSTIFTNISGGGTVKITDGGTLSVGLGGTLTSSIFLDVGATLDQSANPILLSSTLSGFGTVNGPLTVTNAGTISPGGAGVAGTNTIAGNLTETGGAVNQMELSSLGSTNDLIVVSGNLNLAGLNIVSVNPYGSGTVANGTYPLITYTGSLTGGTSNLLVQAIGFTGVLTNITGSPNQIAVIITPASRSVTNLTWVGDGVNNYWDSTSLNWTNLNGTGPFTFIPGDTVNFTDQGAPNTTVTVQDTFVLPGGVLVSNATQNYTFTGPGNITGPFGLTKTNSGTLTILNTNSYLGKTVIGGGVVQVASVANGGSYSPIGAASSDPANLAFYGGTLRYTGTDATPGMDRSISDVAGAALDIANASTLFTESGVITGAGAFTKAGAGTLNFVNANTYSGGTVISNGVLNMGSQNANNNGAGASGVGTTNTTVTFNGGTLALFGYATNTTAGNLASYNLFFNPLVVAAGQTGTIQLPPRGTTATGAGAGLDSTLTGGGTMNLVVDYVRYPLSGNWSAFTGLVNVSGSGAINVNNNTNGAVTQNIDEFRINNTFGYTNAAIFLVGDPNGGTNSPASTLVMCGTVASGTTYNIGELGGAAGTIIGTGTGSEGNTTWSVGWKNTTNTFAGVIANDAPNGVGVTSITKVGTGKWILSGHNTYTGTTSVSNGVLALIPAGGVDAYIGNSTNFFINTNATLSFSALATPTLTFSGGQFIGGGGTFIGNLTVFGGNTIVAGLTNAPATLTITGNLVEKGGVNNQFALPQAGNTGTNDNIVVNGNIDVSAGVNTITLTSFGNGPVTNGTYPLFTYTGSLSGDIVNFNVLQIGTFPYVSTLTNITASKQIAVIITSARATTNLVWTGDGGSAVWDTISPGDWAAGASHFVFESGDSVLFSDSGLSNSTVLISGVGLYPTSVLVSNSVAGTYTFNDGGGSIAGSIGITKTNTGTLSIFNNNTYTGPTVFGGGTVLVSTIANGGVPSPLGAASNNSSNWVFTGGTLAYNGGAAGTDHGLTLNGSGGTISVANGTSLTITGLVAGSGALLVAGSGSVSQNGQGILAFTGASTNSGNIVITNGTVSDLNGQNSANPAVGGLGNPQVAGRTITVNSNGVLSLDATGGNDFGNGNGGTTVKLGLIINSGGLVQITSGNATLGPVTINGGELLAPSTANNSTNFGPYEFGSDITVGGNRPSLIENDAPFNINLTVNAAGNRIFNVADATGDFNSDLNVNGVLGNAGNVDSLPSTLVKAGVGAMTLSGANIYTGGTIVSNGVLLVNGSVSTLGTVSMIGGTLGGSGTIGGPITNRLGGTLAPGAGTNVPGTVLNVSTNLTMLTGSTNVMMVSHAANDRVNMASGTLTYGGLLIVATNDPGNYSVGNTFTLYNLNGVTATGGFNSIQPPPGPGLGWDGSSLTVNGSISVVSASAPVANFSGSPTLGAAALPVTFVNTSSGANYWDWTFGDGSTLSTNSSANLIHTYNTAGTFTVILKAYGIGGTSSLTNTAYIVVTNLPPVPSFVGTPTNGAPPLTVTFTNTTSGVATNWFWTFGDGTTFTTTASTNVSHIYTNGGSYDVGLTATGTGGVVGITNTAYITVSNLVPVAIFSGTPTNIFASQSVTFTNSSTGNGITNWIWNFGDGSALVTNLTGANISHAYASSVSSPYTVSLTINSPGGSSTTNRTGYIVVLPQPSIASVALSGGKLILSGTSGPVGQQYRILTSTNVASALAGWTPVYTNTFTSPSGNYSYTNSAPTNGASFFILVSP
jgi:autotransporter-associated beta strand protein